MAKLDIAVKDARKHDHMVVANLTVAYILSHKNKNSATTTLFELLKWSYDRSFGLDKPKSKG